MASPKKASASKTFEVLVTCYSKRQARWAVTIPIEAKSEEEAKSKAEEIASKLDIEDDEDWYDPYLSDVDSIVIRGSP